MTRAMLLALCVVVAFTLTTAQESVVPSGAGTGGTGISDAPAVASWFLVRLERAIGEPDDEGTFPLRTGLPEVDARIVGLLGVEMGSSSTTPITVTDAVAPAFTKPPGKT